MIFKKVLKGSRRENNGPKRFKRFKKFQDGSRRLKKLQEGMTSDRSF